MKETYLPDLTVESIQETSARSGCPENYTIAAWLWYFKSLDEFVKQEAIRDYIQNGAKERPKEKPPSLFRRILKWLGFR